MLLYDNIDAAFFENFEGTIPLPWSNRIKIALGAAKGLAFLHNGPEPVIYRDFKTSNILLDSVSAYWYWLTILILLLKWFNRLVVLYRNTMQSFQILVWRKPGRKETKHMFLLGLLEHMAMLPQSMWWQVRKLGISKEVFYWVSCSLRNLKSNK